MSAQTSQDWVAVFPDRPDQVYSSYYDMLVFSEYRFCPGSEKPEVIRAYYQAHQVMERNGRRWVYYRRVR